MGSVILLATAIAACASGPQTPLEVLQRSHERSNDIESFRAQMDLEITGPDELVLVVSEIETGRDGRIQTVINIDAFGDKQSFEMIVAEPYVYMKLSDAGWTQMSTATIAASTGQSLESFSDPTAFYGSLFPAQDVPWELYLVESLGLEEVDGVQTEHLSIQFDFQEIWQHLDEEQKQQFLQASPDPDITIDAVVEALEVRGVEVWIDDKGYPRRTVMEFSFSGEVFSSIGGELSTRIDMRMFDINDEITIRLPEGYEDFETQTSARETTAEASVYEELLALIPDTPDTRSWVILADYVLLHKALGIVRPGPGGNQESLEIYFESFITTLAEARLHWGDAPFISGYNREAIQILGTGMSEYLAFDARNVDQSAVAGMPPGQLGVMLGDFDPTATDAALENCAASVPDCEPPLRQSHEGTNLYSWGEEGQDFTRILAPPAYDRLGRGGRIAVQDSHVFYTVETPGMEGLIEASLGRRASLLDVPSFRLLAEAMAQLGAYASFLSDQTLSMEDAITEILSNVSREERERIRAQLAATPALRRYLAFATGGGIDEDGPYMALALVHSDAETAEENVTLLLRRINEADSFYTRQPWAQMVDKTKVRTEGLVLFAKLHGRIARAWLEIVFRRDSLLFHEGATQTDQDTASTARDTATRSPVTPTQRPVAEPVAPAATAPAVEPEAVVEVEVVRDVQVAQAEPAPTTALEAPTVTLPRDAPTLTPEPVQDSGRGSHHAEGRTIVYSVYPPDSGDHWPRWAQCGIYEEEIDDEFIVHNQEHGQVIISHNLY